MHESPAQTDDSDDNLPFRSQHTQTRISIPGSARQIVTDRYKVKSRRRKTLSKSKKMRDGKSRRKSKKTSHRGERRPSMTHSETHSGSEYDDNVQSMRKGSHVRFTDSTKKH